MKRIAFTLILTGFTLASVKAQLFQATVLQEVNKKITKGPYPESLRKKCTPIYTNILFTVNSNGVLDNVLQSDNSPQELFLFFDKNIASIDKKILQRFITYKGLKNCGLLFPIVVLFENDGCKMVLNENLFDIKKCNVYNGKHIDMLTYNFDPLIITAFSNIADHSVH